MQRLKWLGQSGERVGRGFSPRGAEAHRTTRKGSRIAKLLAGESAHTPRTQRRLDNIEASRRGSSRPNQD